MKGLCVIVGGTQNRVNRHFVKPLPVKINASGTQGLLQWRVGDDSNIRPVERLGQKTPQLLLLCRRGEELKHVVEDNNVCHFKDSGMVQNVAFKQLTAHMNYNNA